MTAQHTPPADHAQASNDERSPSAGHQPRDARDAQAMSDEEAVRLMRHWTEEALADPARHSYFPSLVRMLVTFLKTENNRGALREADSTAATPRPKSYELPPVGGIPDTAEVTLDVDDAYRVFSVVLEYVKAWQPDDHVLPNEVAHRRLIEAAQALEIMTRAQLSQMGSLVQAHRDDERAADEWMWDRWMERGRLKQEAGAAEKAQERQRDNEGSDASPTMSPAATAADTARDDREARGA